MGGNTDFIALRTARNAMGRPMAAQATAADITVGVDGSNWVFKNGDGYLLFDDGLYRKEIGVVVEGQPQSGYESTGYTYANIP